jgi:hypothetical protein
MIKTRTEREGKLRGRQSFILLLALQGLASLTCDDILYPSQYYIYIFNIGANGFAFVNTRYATDITNFFGLEFVFLPAPISVKGYNNKSRANIT